MKKGFVKSITALAVVVVLLSVWTSSFGMAVVNAKEFVPERDVMSLVKPSIIYATMKVTEKEVAKGSVVEVLRDNGYGSYLIQIGKRTVWVKGTSLIIPEDPKTNTERLTDDELMYYVNQKGFSSGSEYFVWIDLDRQLLNVFSGSKGNWKLVKSLSCSTGRNVTPTPRGTYMPVSYGKSFGSYNREGAKNYVSFWGDYMVHSLPYLHNKVSDYRVGLRLSHGCVRIAVDESKWFYNTIPKKTTIWIN